MKKWIGRVLLLIAALAFCVIGILREEPGAVLQKAVMICMECIGIG